MGGCPSLAGNFRRREEWMDFSGFGLDDFHAVQLAEARSGEVDAGYVEKKHGERTRESHGYLPCGKEYLFVIFLLLLDF